MLIDGNPYTVVEFQFIKPGKGAAFTRTKFKNLLTGAVLGGAGTDTLVSIEAVLGDQIGGNAGDGLALFIMIDGCSGGGDAHPGAYAGDGEGSQLLAVFWS